MTSHATEPDAGAVILFDIGDSYFFDTSQGYDIRFTRIKRIKVFKRSATDEVATVSIPFYVGDPTKKEKIALIEAYTYNMKDGLTYKTALDPKTIYEEQLNNYWRAKKFAFPDVQDGSIIEYKYILETPFHFNLPDWTFQSKFPTLYSEYTVSMIPFYEYVFVAQGITKFDYQRSEESKKQRVWGSMAEGLGAPSTGGIRFTDMVHTYALKNIPSFTDESFISSADDYIMKMDFQLSKFNRPTGGSESVITTWPALNKAMMDHERFGKFLNSCTRLGKKILEDNLRLEPTLSEDQKVEKIVDHVRSTYKWDGVLDNYAYKSAKDLLNQKVGNVTEINLLLLGLLRSAGVSAEPVLLSTRAHGKIRTDYPFEHYFNATVVLVSGQRTYLTDGTESLVAYDRIPIRFINEKGLVVNEKEPRWVGLDFRAPSVEEVQLNLKINPDKAEGLVSGKITSTEYEAYHYKTQFENDSTKFREYLLTKKDIQPTAVMFYNYDRPRIPYVMMFSGSTKLERAGTKLIVQPLAKMGMNENPLNQSTRTYPVDFIYPQTAKLKATVLIPDGYQAEALPEPITMDNEIAQINLSYTLNGREIEVQAGYSLKKGMYGSSEYSRLKYYLGMIVKGFNAPIVLDKL